MILYHVEFKMVYSHSKAYDEFNRSDVFFSRDDAESFIRNLIWDIDGESPLPYFIRKYYDDIDEDKEIYPGCSYVDERLLNNTRFNTPSIVIYTKSSDYKYVDPREFEKDIPDARRCMSDDEFYTYMLNNAYRGVDYYDTDLNITKSIFEFDYNGMTDTYWGYIDIYQTYPKGDFEVGDAVILDDNKVAIVCGVAVKLEDSERPLLWCDGYDYEGYYLTACDNNRCGDAFASCDANQFHHNIKPYEEPIEEYSYLWVLRERALGRLQISDDDINGHFYKECTFLSTGIHHDDYYMDLPSIKAYIEKHKEAKG